MTQTYTVLSPPDPASTPPPGVIPDFQDPFTLRPYWIVTAALGLVATGIFLALRLYTKIVVVKKLRWEDYTCTLGSLFFAIWIALNFKAIDANSGAHQWNLTERQMSQQHKVQAINFTVAELAFGLICSCIFVLPRLYRHLASTPPYKSEEYQLRKYEGSASRTAVDSHNASHDGISAGLKREQEQRNPWDQDVEAPVMAPTILSRRD
ncbi:MAG: hypothetical protein Q9209_005425 [Squamulea sp. 1 TL-2023]